MTKPGKLKTVMSRKNRADLNQKLESLENHQRVLARSVATVFQNQKELMAAHQQVDDQFSVLTRVALSKLNQIVVRMGLEYEDLYTTYKSINHAFEEWIQFKSRSDFRAYLDKWYMGVPLTEMPPVPDLGANDVEKSSSAAPSPAPEERPSDSGSSEEITVPQVQNPDDAADA